MSRAGQPEQEWDRGDPLDPQFVAAEMDVAAALAAGEFAQWERHGGHVVEEPLIGLPERLFVFALPDGRWYAGYKTISDLVVRHDLPGVFCSRIGWFNVLGSLESLRATESSARLAFTPMDERARRSVFADITARTEIVHPFAKHVEPGREKRSRQGGWLVSEERAAFLGLGEAHLRSYTRILLGPRLHEFDELVVAYDPACSTGQFLAEFQSLDPDRIRTVGQDLSASMVAYARRRVDAVYEGDALVPAVAPGSVDLLFSRFLNSEVVTTMQARRLLPGLVAALRPGGLLVMFGHSPVLLDRVDLVAAGLTVDQTVGRLEDHVFQYYVCRKEEGESV